MNAVLIVSTQPKVAQKAKRKKPFVEAVAQLMRHSRMRAQTDDPTSKLLELLLVQHQESPNYNLLVIGWSRQIRKSVLMARNALKGQHNARLNSVAAHIIAKHGKPSDIPLLKTLFGDKTVIETHGINNKNMSVQVRDRALAACIELEGGSIKDFGFDDDHPGFFDEESREAAFKKYSERSQQPKPLADEPN